MGAIRKRSDGERQWSGPVSQTGVWRGDDVQARSHMNGSDVLSSGDSGDTLIEVLIALAVLGISAASLLLAFATSISASSQHRNLAVSDSILRSAAETIYSAIQSNVVPLACSTTAATYQSEISAYTSLVPSIWSSYYQVSITNVAYWTGSGFSSSACTPGYPQQLSVQVSGLGGTWDEYLVVGGSPSTQIWPSQ